ncbi:hypothetical protein D1007_59174 [Hordeum vulgare]|nr:hypothetical protein D1007_59174 [Hordeum vulgare]
MAPLLLPADLMLEIIARTDLVTLIRCAAACKRLRCDILSQSFLRRVIRLQPRILSYLSIFGDPHWSIHRVTAAAESFCDSHLSPLMLRRIGDLFPYYIPVTSSGGIIVFYRLQVERMRPQEMHHFDLCVYNPMTGDPTFLSKSHLVLTSGTYTHEYVLLTAADGIDYSFMLLIIYISMWSIKVHTITSSSGGWRTVTCASHCNSPWRSVGRYSDAAILHGGIVHWLVVVDHGTQILAYDVSTGMSGVVKLPPTNCNASQLHLATSPDGKRLKLLAIDGFMISVWVQLPTVLAAGSSGWALETVIDIEENLRSLYPSLRAGGGPDIQVQFKPSGKKSSDVVLLRVHGRGNVVLDLETKEVHMHYWCSILLEIDLQSHLQSMKVFS